MANRNQKQQDQKKGGVNPVIVGVTGAVVGAGVAVAGAVALRDKKNRAMVKKAFTDVKDQAMGYVENIQKEVQDKKGEAEQKPTKTKKAL